MKPARRFELDWLRVFATFAVFVMHSLRMFDPMDWEVKNNATSEILLPVMGFLSQWLMPLFFVISGGAIFYSLSSRSSAQFIKSRVSRILIPFALVGVFVLVPPQEYILLAHTKQIPGLAGVSFSEFYPRYVAHRMSNPFMGGFPFVRVPMMHLWYLVYLFAFSVVLLPIFKHLKSEEGSKILSKTTKILDGRIRIFMLALPIAIVSILFNPESAAGNLTSFGGWSLLTYPVFLLTGFLFFSDDRLRNVAKHNYKRYLVLGFLTLPLFLLGMLLLFENKLVFGSLPFYGFGLVRSLNSLFFIFAFIGYASSHLTHSTPKLKYCSEASLPFYMLHQTVIVVIGFFIKDWAISIPLKFLILFTTSFSCITLLYEILVRRINIIRILFGLKTNKIQFG